MNKVTFNTMKITLAAMTSIVIAMILELDFYLAAGILTILTIQTTKKETLKTAESRFFAFLIALLLASFSFKLLGVGVPGFGLYLFLYLFVCQYKQWYSSMAMNSVLITHFLSFGKMTWPGVMNELLLFLIGVGLGIVVNLHLRQDKEMMNRLKNETDIQIRYILDRISLRILRKIEGYDGQCFDVLNDLITKAKLVGKENNANVIFQKDDFDYQYIRMRERQSQILYEMYKIVREMNTSPLTAQLISNFVNQISEEYSSENDCSVLLNHFYEIDSKMKKTPLPVVRSEFEDRARLFGLLRLIEEFLKLKNHFVKNNG